ncbi:MAG: cytochrome o ubiquinol oxidase subunit IV [Pseudomonas fluorescens]|nr:MAG: cytochrome o ubiquinol oxidase subunit IV [Pseudomonas fluorescens]
MSAAKTSKVKAHAVAHGHDVHDHHDDHAAHGTLNTYLIGFALSVFLTIIPFWLVMGRPLEGVFDTNVPVAFLLLAFAVVQMVVHMVFFLHMSPKSEGGWTLMALFFTLILVVIVMSGSMWVMYHMNTNMMPVHDMSNMDTTGEGWLPSQQQPFPPAEGTEQPAPQPAVQPPAKQ